MVFFFKNYSKWVVDWALMKGNFEFIKTLNYEKITTTNILFSNPN